jgi:hypothetical protein
VAFRRGEAAVLEVLEVFLIDFIGDVLLSWAAYKKASERLAELFGKTMD